MRENQRGLMKKLKLPVIREPIYEAKALSMDEYFKFVQFHLKHTFDRKAYARWKEMLIVNVPFFIK